MEAILPYSTHRFKSYIPNIYELATVSSSNFITFTSFNTSELDDDASILQVKTIDGESQDVTLADVLDEHSVRVEEDLNAGDKLFIYGQIKEDVRGLKKDAIWTVATSALQEVDRQLQTEKNKVTDLLARVEALESR